MQQDAVLVRLSNMDTNIELIKRDQSSLYVIVEKLAQSVEKITDSLKVDHLELRREYEKIQNRLLVLETNNAIKKSSINTWIAPIVIAVIASLLTLIMSNHLS